MTGSPPASQCPCRKLLPAHEEGQSTGPLGSIETIISDWLGLHLTHAAIPPVANSYEETAQH